MNSSTFFLLSLLSNFGWHEKKTPEGVLVFFKLSFPKKLLTFETNIFINAYSSGIINNNKIPNLRLPILVHWTVDRISFRFDNEFAELSDTWIDFDEFKI